jgi:hypothetical protein
MNTGHSSLPELIVELAPSVRVTVKDEGLLAKKVERKYLRRRAP